MLPINLISITSRSNMPPNQYISKCYSCICEKKYCICMIMKLSRDLDCIFVNLETYHFWRRSWDKRFTKSAQAIRIFIILAACAVYWYRTAITFITMWGISLFNAMFTAILSFTICKRMTFGTNRKLYEIKNSIIQQSCNNV